MAYLWVCVAIILGLVSYFGPTGSKNASWSSARSGRKGQQAKAMRAAFKALEKQDGLRKRVVVDKVNNFRRASDPDRMKIAQLWIYPIKSIRGCQVSSAILTPEGFYLDRHFMLLKDHDGTPQKLENMHITKFPQMCLFHPSIEDSNTLTITYRPPGSKSTDAADSLEIPFEPASLVRLEKIPIAMHSSPSTGYNMGERYNGWLSDRFGFRVVLAHWGRHPRPVLGNLPGQAATQGPRTTNPIARGLGSVPVLGPWLGLGLEAEPDADGIAFNDCAPYLVINEASVADVSARLPPGVEMDLTKFRANVVVTGGSAAAAGAYAEDFWGELRLGVEGEGGGSRIILTGNCGRCKSLNVDYATGESGTGRDGEVLKLLQKDRRVDPGVKYSPIFGRYGFVARGDEGAVLRVGDEVVVSRRNEERTRFYWPGIST